ncbi:chaplin [Allosalinactinospora lopnorensis]|uniref:chaplin n=1 Tax=Allosalinactinospora lopnorensis TaxID=1352348 RepID=UPI000623D4DF|nr:chaplin [Allosalinactinospora lopnorensis]
MRKKLYASASVTVLTAGLVSGATSIAFAAPGTDDVGSGNQVNVPANVKAELCGNSLAALGISEAECQKVAETLYAESEEGQGGSESGGSDGVAQNNEVNIPVNAAVDICGNSAAVGGLSKAGCTKVMEDMAEESGEDGGEEGGSESGGTASGNTINVPVDVAVDICGNSLAVLGESEADCEAMVGDMQESEDNGAGSENNGSGGTASGNEVNVPVNAAVDICGNAVSVLGTAEASCMKKISEEEAPEEEAPEEEKPEKPEKPGDEGDKGEKEEEAPEDGKEDEADEGDEQAAPGDDSEQASGGLPVTGSALAGLIAAAAAALGGGGAAMYFARKRKAASALGDEA